jgi:iron complex transport system substrate-binding protein
MSRFGKVLLVILSSLSLFSCSNNKNDSSSYEVQTITDSKNRTLEIKKEISKICITFNLEEYFAIGGEDSIDKIVGWSHSYWYGRRNDAYEAYTNTYPSLKEKTDVGYGSSINVETIISLSPDVVIASSSADYTYFESKLSLLEKANIPVVFIDYHTDTIESIKKSNETLGKLLNKEQRAQEISTYYESKVSPIFEKAKVINDEDKPNVYMEFSKGKDTYGNTWSKKMWGSLIQQVGGKNIAYDISDANSVDMAKEAIIKYNPDIIIFTGVLQSGLTDNVVLGYNQDEEKAKINLASYLKRNEWKDVNAVKNNNLSAVYHDLSRHVFDFAGVEFLAKKIQPTLFKDLDPMKDLKEFFSLYMPFELNGCFMIEL